MNVSRLLPFLPLLMLLPYSAALVFPSTNQPQLNPSDLCPLVRIVEHELCSGHLHLQHNANNATDLCVLLHNYNASFCSKKVHLMEHSPLSDDAMSVRILEKEFHEQWATPNANDKVCPIINFIEQELCTSRSRQPFEFYPKQLCPLLNLTYTEFCE